MYESYFGLKEKPFSLTPDPGFFYRYDGHQQALNVLLLALKDGEGFIQVTGEVGTGKTLLCRRLLQLLEDSCATAYLPNPLLSPVELYRAIAEDLRLEVADNATLQQLSRLIARELVRLKSANRPMVILIDEAQAMEHRSLEALRLLSNLETEKEKLLHIVFFAQPEFKQRLTAPDLRQLRQRISFSCDIAPLATHEVGSYLHHRLHVAGHGGGRVFSAAAIRRLAAASGGVPRILNQLAHKALLVAYGKGSRQITGRMAAAAVRDFSGTTEIKTAAPAGLMLRFGGLLAIVIALIATWSVLR